MVKNIGGSGQFRAPGQKPRDDRSGSTNSKQDDIVLPALKANEEKVAPAILRNEPVATKSSKKLPKAKKQSRVKKNKSQAEINPSSARIIADTRNDYLPEYRSRTNGLRELLSSIDPMDKAYHSQAATFEPNLTETAMHIPHSRPGIPGSPDLPIGPTRWGLYLSGAIGALAFLLVSALAYSHISSPTGIDWQKLQAKTGETYQWVVASLSGQTNPQAGQQVAKNDVNDPASTASTTSEMQFATASRISTTAASPKRGTIKTPTAAEIFISTEELENQIRALEGKDTISGKKSAPRKIANKAAKAKRAKPARFDQLVVVPAAKIDPDMENQIFKRASSYLKQRDISSARMILQYAATLGSGISAMALAETFDPNYLKRVNLHGVDSSPTDARKWYDMAARLGITEANNRITALK